MSHQDSPTPSRPWRVFRRLFSAQESGLVLVILLISAALTLFGGTTSVPAIDAATGQVLRDDRGAVVRVEQNKFLNAGNLVLVLNNASFIAVMAVGMTAVIITAGIDLSVGSIYALAGLLGAMALQRMGAEAAWFVAVPALLAICMLGGAALGLANGALIVGLRLHPFIITLGTLSVYRGITLLPTRGQTVSGLPASMQTAFFKNDLGLSSLGVANVHPMNAGLMILVALIGGIVLKRLVIGRRVYAIGGNETAARYAGIPVGRVKVLVYTAMGLLAGLSAAMAVGYYGSATTAAGGAYELRVIAAAVIGGASLSGGRGTALGAVLGAIVIQLIDNAISILGIDNNYLLVVTGAAIIVAAAIDRLKQGLGAARA